MRTRRVRMITMTPLLFLLVVTSWGLTWFAIHLQIGPTPTEVSILWRFALAAALLGAWLVATRRLRPVPRAVHPWLMLLGACLFSCNFLGIYGSEALLPSGAVSVIFSMATVFNVINQWVFFRTRPGPRSVAGAVCGIVGVALMSAGQNGFAGGDAGGVYRGVALALGGTLLFSCGNMVARRVATFGLDLPNAIFRGMSYGCVILACVTLLRGHNLLPVATTPWIGGLLYLSIIGSVLGFLAYLSLAQRIGADRAAYTTVLSPLIALCVSTFFEHTSWTAITFLGIVLILAGNVVVFAKFRRG